MVMKPKSSEGRFVSKASRNLMRHNRHKLEKVYGNGLVGMIDFHGHNEKGLFRTVQVFLGASCVTRPNMAAGTNWLLSN